MGYSKELNEIIENELTNLIELKKANKGPFSKEIVQKYYEKFQNL